MPATPSIKLGLVENETMFRKSLISLIEQYYKNCIILFDAENGIDLQQKINKNTQPDIILMDVSMPRMDGFASVQWLKDNYPEVKVLVLSMIDKEETIVRMLKLGVKGYLCKDVDPEVLGEALHAVANKGFFYTDFLTGKLVHSLQDDPGAQKSANLNVINSREKEFLLLACSEMTYQEIADKMCLSPKTIDGYRNSLFEKFNVKSRVGLVMYAIKNGYFKID